MSMLSSGSLGFGSPFSLISGSFALPGESIAGGEDGCVEAAREFARDPMDGAGDICSDMTTAQVQYADQKVF
jgi:hypothetical protein